MKQLAPRVFSMSASDSSRSRPREKSCGELAQSRVRIRARKDPYSLGSNWPSSHSAASGASASEVKADRSEPPGSRRGHNQESYHSRTCNTLRFHWYCPFSVIAFKKRRAKIFFASRTRSFGVYLSIPSNFRQSRSIIALQIQLQSAVFQAPHFFFL